jgi:hypothetical protein
MKYVGYLNLWPIPKKYWLKMVLPPFQASRYIDNCYQIRLFNFVFFVESL